MGKFLKFALMGVLSFSTTCLAGIDLVSGPWNLNVSGGISGYYTLSKCSSANVVAGGFTCAGTEVETSIQSGYFVPSIVFNVSTTQSGIDLGATIGYFNGINNLASVGANGTSGNVALGTAGIDVAKIYLTLGLKNLGTFKIGRDLGFFAGLAATNDLAHVGAIFSQDPPGNGTIGLAGSGYIYADFLPQLSFSSAAFYGANLSIGVFQPLNAVPFPGTNLSGTSTLHSFPALESQFAYTYDDKSCFKANLWTSFLYQHHQARTSAEHSFHSFGVDGGTRLDVGNFNLVGYIYFGHGLGLTGLFLDSISTTGAPRKTLGGYAQLSAVLNPFTMGMSFGRSGLQKNASDAPELVQTNQTITAFVHFALTESVSLATEYTNVLSKNWADSQNNENTFALGSSFFF